MKKTLTLEEADALVTKNDRYFWETYGKVLLSYRPARDSGVQFRKDAYFNRRWNFGRGRWGTVRRIHVSNEGTFTV